MKIVVVGAGRLGAELSHRLVQHGHQVSLVVPRGQRGASAPADFRGLVVEGDPLERDVLERAGLAEADGLAAVTDLDSVNAVVAHAARSHYGLHHVVARNSDPRRWVFLESFALQAVGTTLWGAQRIEEILMGGEDEAVLSAGNGEVQLYELAIPGSWQGRSLGALIDGAECVAVSVTRGGHAVMADDFELEVGDTVLVSATLDGIGALRGRLAIDQHGSEG